MRKPILKIVASRADVQAYRLLLLKQWRPQTLESATKLIRRLARLPEGWFQAAPRPSTGRAQARRAEPPYPIPAVASEHLREFLQQLNADLPSVPDETPAPTRERQRRLWATADELALLLNLRRFVDVVGDVGLFRDAQSLAWQCALEFLLPDMHDIAMKDECSYLINAMWSHAMTDWQDEPGQQMYMAAILLEWLGDVEGAGERYLQALRHVSPEEHQFLTLAHAYWFHLLDAGKTKEAEKFLFSLHRSVPERLAAEVETMIRQQHARMGAA